MDYENAMIKVRDNKSFKKEVLKELSKDYSTKADFIEDGYAKYFLTNAFLEKLFTKGENIQYDFDHRSSVRADIEYQADTWAKYIGKEFFETLKN